MTMESPSGLPFQDHFREELSHPEELFLRRHEHDHTECLPQGHIKAVCHVKEISLGTIILMTPGALCLGRPQQ